MIRGKEGKGKGEGGRRGRRGRGEMGCESVNYRSIQKKGDSTTEENGQRMKDKG